MSFDKDTRKLLAKTVTACRHRLIEDVTDQLRGVFGLHPDGTMLALDELTYLSPDQAAAARRLRDLLDHYTAGAAGKESDRRKAAYERMVLEISFTVLNRLAALRLCEERGLLVECVRQGTASAGFQMFERISGGALGSRYDTYRVFLECLFDEFALDLGVLFDRMTPQSAVFPSERCMEDVLAELNKAELTQLWSEDETIGWIYQYFNPPEERKAMRDASAAPRNSRELAVRNQFFTPRYVVEFLTDNTLGRIWYEMRKGDTALKEECRYLVRRPNEVFLAEGEKAPPEPEGGTDLPQEKLLKQPVYIKHWPKKDPRDIRVLDPACGSGHFLLYAFDFIGVTDEGFWEQAEDRILDALKEYSEEAENGRTVMRRLFAEDAARGFAFIDICRKRYDVVLMNPPFGQPTSEVFQLMRSKYQGAHNDIFCSFVRWAIGALGTGRVGVITSRSFLLAPRLEAFRTNEIIPHMEQLVDFGLGVMDDAYVESAAYVLNNLGSPQFQSFDLRSSAPDHQQALEHLIQNHSQQLSNNSWYYNLPKSKILYTAPPDVRRLLNSKITFEPTAGTAREGMKSFNNERFIRLWWEINPSLIGRGRHWVNMAKGGGFSFFYSDIHLLLNWSKNGLELQAVNQAINGSTAQVRQASDYWYLPGATYSKRSARGFSARALPSDCIFTSNGPAVLPYGDLTPAFILGWLNSKPVRAIIHMQANFADYSTGALKKIPWQIRIQDQERERLEGATIETIERLREIKADNETSICFRTVQHNQKVDESIEINRDELIYSLMQQWDTAISKGYGLDDLGWAEESLNQEAEVATNDQGRDEDDEGESENFTSNTLGIIAYSLGCIFGRWEVRISIDPSLAPKLPDPFGPLPVCPPGMLVGPDGLPAEPNRIVSKEWLRARPGANTLPPKGAVKKTTIPDLEYPLWIAWNGILVDDPGFNGAQPHSDDIVRRVREVLDLLWKDKAHEIEQEACDILGVSDLRDYFRKPAKFFQDHLKRYTKSRRKAPIYWPLSTASGSYTIWLYYHRLTDQTLYAAVNKYVEPKISEIERGLARIEDELKAASGEEATRMRDRLNEAQTFLGELRDLREELLRIAALPYKPNLNDGVIINAAPLTGLFRLRSWANIWGTYISL